MRSVSRSRRDDQGYVLLLALGFITFVGVIALALVSYTTTNLSATINLRQIRAEQFAADGAVDGAINAVRTIPPPAAQTLCFSATLNQQPVDVYCSPGSLANTVIFTACRGGGGACTPASAILVAEATFSGADGPVTVNSWSVRR